MNRDYDDRDEAFETYSEDDRAQIEYHMALDDAEKAGEPWFSFKDFMARAPKREPAPLPEGDEDDDIPF